MYMEIVALKISMCFHKNKGLSISLLGVSFPTSLLISLIFITSHADFMSVFLIIVQILYVRYEKRLDT